jgi:hypothetical protein
MHQRGSDNTQVEELVGVQHDVKRARLPSLRDPHRVNKRTQLHTGLRVRRTTKWGEGQCEAVLHAGGDSAVMTSLMDLSNIARKKKPAINSIINQRHSSLLLVLIYQLNRLLLN